LRICGDCSVTAYPQLEVHQHPLAFLEESMRRLGGGCGFTKTDVADAYNRVRPEKTPKAPAKDSSQVLLQNVLPFGIGSAPGYFKQVMNAVNSDFPGVAVYLEDILGSWPAQHRKHTYRIWADCLKGYRFAKRKFAQPQVLYVGHVLSGECVSRGTKINVLKDMQAPHHVSTLRSFLGTVHFYT